MRIIPVIDLQGGTVVRGVAGRRSEYRPVESVLCDRSSPAAIAAAFRDHLGLSEAYLADLDAIAGGEPAWECYEAIISAGLHLWVDAGLADLARAEAFAKAPAAVTGIIAGLESLGSPQQLAEIASCIGAERLLFSLDLKGGEPLVMGEGWGGKSPAQIAELALAAGIRRLIVLDLARVGMAAGTGTEGLCRQLRDRQPEIDLVAGGGVRSWDDLQKLAAAGVSGVLVASALHDGSFDRHLIQRAAGLTG